MYLTEKKHETMPAEIKKLCNELTRNMHIETMNLTHILTLTDGMVECKLSGWENNNELKKTIDKLNDFFKKHQVLLKAGMFGTQNHGTNVVIQSRDRDSDGVHMSLAGHGHYQEYHAALLTAGYFAQTMKWRAQELNIGGRHEQTNYEYRL